MPDQHTKNLIETITNQIVNEVADCTDRNDHTGSLIVICKAFNFAGSLDELETIKRRHEQIGHMTDTMIYDRSNIMEHILKLVAEGSPAAADKLRSAL